MKTLKSYELDQCALYKCKSKKRLEDILQKNGALKDLNSIIKYTRFQEPKHNGSFREILAPVPELKIVQRRILKLLSPIKKPSWVISATKGKSYINNAEQHREAIFLITMDIHSFYANCNRDYVYRFFSETMKMSGDTAKILTDICTYGILGSSYIPTGGPTSQIIAYFAYQKMFEEISRVAETHGCTFTLYVDDMTFSSSEPTSSKGLVFEVDKVLHKYGHKAKTSKTKYYSRSKAKLVTGVAISSEHELMPSNKLQHRVMNNFREFLMKRDIGLPTEQLAATITGQIQATRNIKTDKFPEVYRQVREETTRKQ